MDLGKGDLVDRLEKDQNENPRGFPQVGGANYFHRYSQIADYLNQKVHPHVNLGAMLNDGGYLTAHGPDHIKKVISRASQLVRQKQCNLTPYEIYILLVAIHFHDVGNIFGRVGHEKNSATVMRDMGSLAGADQIEKRYILKIAEAHGGSTEEDKTKIDHLPPTVPILGENVRIQFLAAILKFSDEISEDKDRAAVYLLAKDIIPPESDIHHRYAAALHSVVFDYEANAIELHFDIPVDLATRQFKNNGKSKYILDEIFSRTLKTHLERIYCSRFIRPHIEINEINVKLEIYQNNNYEKVVETIGYSLKETGYPTLPPNGIYDLCPELKTWNEGHRLDGDNLANKLLGTKKERS